MRVTATANDPSLPLGAYKPNFGKINRLPGLNQGAPYSAAIVWPTPQSSDEKFPVLSFAHGTGVGSTNPESAISYNQVLKFVASFGFIIVAPDSCPLIECASGFAHDEITALKAVKENPGLHPSLASADFNRTGVFGHSMGGNSAIVSDGGGVAKPYRPADYNIKAAVSQHCGCPSQTGACRDYGSKGSNVPFMYTNAKGDTIANPAGSTNGYNLAGDGDKIVWMVKGGSHFEPADSYVPRLPSGAGGANREDLPIALFFACHIRRSRELPKG